jgi:CelD/BcsL family acetyltransferase involved in cellulose biosynthesis
MFRLALNGIALAAMYALADPPERNHRSLYLYLIGINTRFAELSPGTLLQHAVWEYARAEGFSEMNLLRGGETYKQLWGAEPQPTFTLYASSRRDA